MRFQVPQYIEVEDKIFGPLTFKQFIYTGGGVGICVILFVLLPRFLAILLSLPVLLFAAGLAFYTLNGKPFVAIVEAFVKYILTNRLYIWKKESPVPTSSGSPRQQKPLEQIQVPKLSESRLKDLTWSLGVKENQNPVTKDLEDEL